MKEESKTNKNMINGEYLINRVISINHCDYFKLNFINVFEEGETFSEVRKKISYCRRGL